MSHQIDIGPIENVPLVLDDEEAEGRSEEYRRSQRLSSKSILPFMEEFDTEFGAELEKSKRRFKCRVCKKSLSTKETLRKHILARHLKIKPFDCTECDKKFVFERSLLEHSAVHGQIPLFDCFCGKNFKVKSSYLSHIRQVHQAASSTKFECSSCEKSFNDSHTLEIHMNSVHKPKTIKCSHKSCNKVFSTISLMHAHYRCHSDVYYVCFECHKTFKSEAYLRKHELTHNGVRPFKCDECGQTYLSLSHLNQHRKRAHLTTNHFQCIFCGKVFKTKEQLTYHENAHQGEKPFICNICGFKTAYRNSLCSHKKVHSKLEEKKEADITVKRPSCKKKKDSSDTFTKSCNSLQKRKLRNSNLQNLTSKATATFKVRNKKDVLNLKPKTKNRMKKSTAKSFPLVEKDGEEEFSLSHSVFCNLDVNEPSSLSEEALFLNTSPTNMFWNSELYPDWISQDTLTPKHKPCPNVENKVKLNTSLFPRNRLDKNITLNCTALDHPNTKPVSPDTSFLYD